MISQEPSKPGDISASVQFAGSVSGVTSVPFTLRSVVPPKNYSFTGTITGGNGRQSVAQAQIYYLDVPRGQKNLGIGVKLADTGNAVFATLPFPSGRATPGTATWGPMSRTALPSRIMSITLLPVRGCSRFRSSPPPAAL